VLVTLIGAALWISGKDGARPAPATGVSAGPVPVAAPASTAQTSSTPEVDGAALPSAAPTASAPARTLVQRPRAAPKPSSTSPAPKPPATRGRGPFLPPSPFGN
jgi:hypothetical protein